MKTIITSLIIVFSTPAWAELIPQNIIRNTSNEIDQLVANSLAKKKVTANPIIDDATFARRCYINISGRIPTIDEAKSFINDPSPDKRALLVDDLILSNGHKSQMFNFWANLLRVQTNKDKHGLGWHVWIRDAVDTNMPYDKFVNSMLSASGSAVDDPAVGYYLRDQGMLLDNVSNSVQIFLGNRIGCAQCHDHPTEDMTQKQYYELAAFSSSNSFKSEAYSQFFKKVTSSEFKPSEKNLDTPKALKEFEKSLSASEKVEFKELGRQYGYLFRGMDLHNIELSEKPEQPLKLPHDYQYNDGKPGDIVDPQVFFGEKIHATKPEERKKAFADWITTPENPYFTKVIVNRLWAEAFGKGIVEPLDDWSETTTISNPELLDYLTKVMIATKYDVREFMRVLYNTRLFESSVAEVEDNMGESCDFKGPVLRRMKAEEFHDSLLTIEHGNQDSTVNHNLKAKWDKYIASVNNIYTMPLEDLSKLKDASSIRRSSNLDAQKYRNLIKQAEKEGEQSKVAEYEKKLKAVQVAQKAAKKAASEEIPEMNMMMMSYGGNIKSSGFVRASEKAAPDKPGGLLRKFGASDRGTPDAAHTGANIPQALTLLNGNEISRLATRQSTLMKATLEQESPSERLNSLFLGIYGALPSEAERAKFEPLVSDDNEIKKLARAMISSKRFIFVQ